MSDSSLLSALRASFASSATVPTPPSRSVDLTTDEQLEIFDQVLTELEFRSTSQLETATPDSVPTGTLASAVPQFTLQSTDTLNSFAGTATPRKEGGSQTAVETAVIEAGLGLQVVEEEKVPELPPEVESFLQRVEEHQAQVPQEIVIADGTTQLPTTTHHPSQPVIILPITPDVEKAGEHKSPKFSIRWLVEWSHKIIKMFVGQVIYRQV